MLRAQEQQMSGDGIQGGHVALYVTDNVGNARKYITTVPNAQLQNSHTPSDGSRSDFMRSHERIKSAKNF